MISVVIPTLNAEQGLAATLAALIPAAVDGLVREVIIVDGGSNDRTLRIADDAGAQIVPSESGRGRQLIAGAAKARSDWILFLHADTVLEAGWEREVATLMERVGNGARPATAASFRFTLDDVGFKPRVLENLVSLRCLLLRLPYGDQGLLIPRRLYEQLGGYRAMPLMEDVDLVRRLGRGRLVLLRARAVTSAVRYRRDGYTQRSLRNFACLMLFYLRIPVARIARIYG